MSCIKSIGTTNQEVIQNILNLHIKSDCFDLDPCFSFGKFYKGLKEPIQKFDINPQREDVQYADSAKLPISDSSVNSIMFDPPFCFGVHGKTLDNISAKRFTMFNTFADLCIMYQDSLKEFYRVLIRNGFLVFKCQDYTDAKTTMTHCLVYNWATTLDFYAKDLFILLAQGGRIYNPNLRQRHARKFHSYFWILQKR